MRYGLGLDLGSASVGWAIVDLGPKRKSGPAKAKSVVRLGVRRFDAGVSGDISGGRDESNAVERRNKRAPRRQHWRRAQRIRRTFSLLVRMGLFPDVESNSSQARHEAMLQLDEQLRLEFPAKTAKEEHLLPYRIRAAALDQPLSPYALGRALYSLAQRRGFQSNRKAAGDDEAEDGVVKKGIAELDQEMEAAGARTIGDFFSQVDPEQPGSLRRRWTSRRMFREEFERIVNCQKQHHPVLNGSMCRELERAIFFQRPLKSQKGLIGRCELECYPVRDNDGNEKWVGRRRAALACLPYQEFRILQKINDLVITAPNGEIMKLKDPEQEVWRKLLLDKLSDQGEM
ncbi:MAG: type II CRISPR RNA-guided endonuclease Cas9, partial [Planctomycetota bacterium]